MFKKCDANCDARYGADQNLYGYHLWLRNNIFYYRIELKRENNKRRYKRISLHTSNFYEAREILKNMTTDYTSILDEIRTLYNNLDFVLDLGSNWGQNGNHGVIPQYLINKGLSKRNKISDIRKLRLLSLEANEINPSSLNQEDQKLLETVARLVPTLEEFLKQNTPSQPKPSAPTRQIDEVLDMMLNKGRNCPAEQTRKRNTIQNLLEAVGLTLTDDYSKFHNVDVLNAISKFVKSQQDVKGNTKRRRLRYIKELATYASKIDPNVYTPSIIYTIPDADKTKKSEKNPHKPYTQEQLLEIFNPKHSYFKDNPDAFWVCLIALFTGARANSACTLQYQDILEKNGIWCINFIEDHDIKNLKNEASERIVPIHQQLLDLGFVDYVQRRKKRLDAKGTDFIFSRCQTKGGLYNNKYTVRYIFNFFTDIGVKSGSNDGYDFHSFRKNASIAMQDAGVGHTYIKDIIGWEGRDTMEQSYSNHTLAQINAELNKFSYDFLSVHFAKWKKIMKTAK